MSEKITNEKTILVRSLEKSLGGGVYGMTAMSTQVISLMWLRTTVNYQYKNGTKFRETLKILYKEGGIKRFYRGISPALLQAPLSRFGDTASNTGMLYYLNNNDNTKNLSIGIKTFCGSFCAGLWRINLMPIDTTKTILQVHGNNGINILKDRIKSNGIRTLYNGSMGAFSATLIGHFPWFFTFNYLNENIPKQDTTIKNLSRYAVIGFMSSFTSDITSNSLRVIKTSKQTYKTNKTYYEIITNIIKQDGYKSLFFRGLQTKILSNGLQGLLFAIIWKGLENHFNN